MLLGETQNDLATAMKEYFSLNHYTVDLENNGLRILECLHQNQYDIIIFELALPGLDGISITHNYRALGGSTPILLMASKHSSDELQRGFEAGADAFVVKPFQLNDLNAQIKALMRRPALRSERVLTLANVAMDTEAGTVTRDDISVHLYPMEFKLLQFLLRHPNQVFSAHAIFERVWQKKDRQMDDTIRTHIRTLRQKIDLPGSPSIVTTVRGFGYKTEKT
jgi:DNA-binding response OmpR family regulator